MLIDGVLCRDDEELTAQRIASSVHCHLSFGHRFQQRTLGARSRAIDLIHQQNFRKDGALAKFKFVGTLIEDIETRDIARKQIGRALASRKSAADSGCERLCQCRFSKPRLVLQQQMSVCQKADKHQFDNVCLASQCKSSSRSRSLDREARSAVKKQRVRPQS